MSPPAVEFPSTPTPAPARVAGDMDKPHVTKQESPVSEKKLTQPPKSESSTQLAYSLDRESNTLSVKITDQVSGDVLRTLQFKGFKPETHDLKDSKGHLFDGKS